MPSTEKATAAAKVKQAPLNEPSPASTYGDTAGSSTPATPVEAGGQHGKSSIFLPLCLHLLPSSHLCFDKRRLSSILCSLKR